MEDLIGEVVVGDLQEAELFLVQYPSLGLRPFAPEDRGSVECRICGRPWRELEGYPDLNTSETCNGSCLEGTSTQAWIIIERKIPKLSAQEIDNDIAEEFFALLEKKYKLRLTEEQRRAFREVIPIDLMIQHVERYEEKAQ